MQEMQKCTDFPFQNKYRIQETRSGQGQERLLTIKQKNLPEGTPLDQYVMSVEAVETIQRECQRECAQTDGPPDANQPHWTQQEVEIRKTTRFLPMRILLREGPEDGREHFIDRQMTAYDSEFSAFGMFS